VTFGGVCIDKYRAYFVTMEAFEAMTKKWWNKAKIIFE